MKTAMIREYLNVYDLLRPPGLSYVHAVVKGYSQARSRDMHIMYEHRVMDLSIRRVSLLRVNTENEICKALGLAIKAAWTYTK